MADLVLVALNAHYIHSSFGLRCLLANLGELRPRTRLLEFTTQHRAIDLAEQILAEQPKIVGLGVYVWNVTLCTELISLLARLAPQVHLVVGGPEISHETEQQELASTADYVIQGEADLAFAALARRLLRGDPPPHGVSRAAPPDLATLASPYPYYDADDIANRVIYVEASRGCPFRCEFCLSSLDRSVRPFPLEPLLAELGELYERGVRHFKFVDRTFNLDLPRARAILEFFARRAAADAELLVHFEMIPDRLPDALRETIASFPAGVLQLEVGIQTFDAEVAARIDRRQDSTRVADNLRWLRAETAAHVHADLIVGLPGETLAGFGRGFDQLHGLRPQEIQVGILKRLRGTPIRRHDTEWQMVYSDRPPYQLLQSKTLSFAEMQEMARFARFWDRLANSGQYVELLHLLLDPQASPFAAFRSLAARLYHQFDRAHGIAAPRLATALFDYASSSGLDREAVGTAMVSDHLRGGRLQLPEVLRPFLSAAQRTWIGERRRKNPAARRQDAFLGTTRTEPESHGT